MRHAKVWISVLLMAAGGVLVAQDGFRRLFANDDLSEWVEEYHTRMREPMRDRNAFSVSEGVLTCDGSVGNVGFIRYKPELCNFELRAEFRVGEGCNSGICFRAPSYNGSTTPAHTGFELQILQGTEDDPTSNTGGLYSVNPPLVRTTIHPNEWYRVRILAEGDRVQAWINNVMVQDFDQAAHEQTRERPRCGYLFFQSHGGDIAFRNVRLRD